VRSVVLGVLLVAVLTACGGDDEDTSAAGSTAPEKTSNPKYELTFRDWENAELTPGEEAFQSATRIAMGIGTNPPKMLEYGYDLCERYEQAPDEPRAEAIRDFALENSLPTATASTLGSAATRHLCPD
jgi:hypothetical protein